ncbi:kinase-like protein [Thelephora ganbajun]|uniref:Kinase-like protein n=1 Tax=Thelephora ganbajun TaxID=370292 RepID=A0ACB6ZBY7_THEGA|nr:kinase-like protein [Thelephora ganbajun]
MTPFAGGGFGCMSQVQFEGRRIAVKTFFTPNGMESPQRIHKLFAREVVGWKWLQHENVLPFVGVTPKFAIVLDFMENGNIMGFIKKHPHHNRLHLLVGAASGLEYLHDHSIVHGDLKGIPAIGSTTGGGGLGGTTRWMAPEMLWPENFKFPGDVQKRLPSKSTDIYVLGMTTLEVTRGKKPDRPPSGFSDRLWNLLLKAWDLEDGFQPPKRPPVQPILNQMKEDADDWDQIFVSMQRLQVEGEENCMYPAHLTT